MRILIQYKSSQESYDTVMILESETGFKLDSKKPNYRIMVE